MIDTRSLRKLLLQTTTATASDMTADVSEENYISAASGISRAGDYLYVVADDALTLGVFNIDSSLSGTTITLLPGKLAHEPAARKAQKPDFEVLTHWRGYNGASGGALLALGSGSKQNRRRGVVIPLDNRGRGCENVFDFDLSALYLLLETRLASLNIEGALTTDNELWLFQRGNSANGKNAIVRMPIGTLDALIAGNPVDVDRFDPTITEVALGELNGVPLSFTDATRLTENHILYVAAAEDTADTYLDGKCAGSVLGMLNHEGVVQWQIPIQQRCKVEGISAWISDNGRLECLMVTDADDPSVPADLLSATLELSP